MVELTRIEKLLCNVETGNQVIGDNEEKIEE